MIGEFVADELNIDRQTTFQSYAVIDDNVVISGTDNEIVGTNISNSSASGNDECIKQRHHYKLLGDLSNLSKAWILLYSKQ